MKFFSHMKKEAESIRLSQAERESMRSRLEQEMLRLPLTKSPFAPTPSPYFSFVLPRALVPVLVAVLVVVSGTSYAAEGAIPGDLLYGVKLGLNESVREAMATSVEAKAAWHTEAAERRMKEAEILSAEGALTAEVTAELETRFETHAVQVEERLEQIETGDPVLAADLGARFESALAAHSDLIARLSIESDGESRRHAEGFARKLKQREERLALAGGSAGNPVVSTASLRIAAQQPEDAATFSAPLSVEDTAQSDENIAVEERLSANASTTLDQAVIRFEAIKGTLPSSTQARVQAQIESVQKQILLFRKGGLERRLIERAFKDAATIKAFLEVEGELKGRTVLPSLDIHVPEPLEPGHEEERAAELQPLVKPLPL